MNQLPDHGHHQEAARINGPLDIHPGDTHALGQPLRVFRLAVAQEGALPPLENDEAQQHANTRRAKAPGPAIDLTQPATEQCCAEGADVDAHVENREARITTGVSLGIELTDHCRNIGFEKSDPDHNQRQREVEDR